MENISHMVDEVCKKVGTIWLPLGAKRGAKREDSLKPSSYPRSRRTFGFPSNKDSKIYELRTNQDEEASSSFKNKRNVVATKIHEVNCKSPQGGCI